MAKLGREEKPFESSAAVHYRFLGRHDLANKMSMDARYAYLRWGATAKVAEMDRGEEG